MSEILNGLMGAVIGGLIVTIGQYLLSESQRKRDANYAAIRIVCALEEYFEKCLEVVFDDGTIHGQMAGRTEGGEEYRLAQVLLPSAIEYPDDLNWKSLHPKLMFRAFQLSNSAISTNRVISAAGDESWPPEEAGYFLARHEGYARLGIEALELSKAFRKRYCIPSEATGDPNLDWNPEEYLRTTLKRIEDRQKILAPSPLDSLKENKTETGNA